MSHKVTNCSYCNETLDELEQLSANKYVHEIPLCAQCIEIQLSKRNWIITR